VYECIEDDLRRELRVIPVLLEPERRRRQAQDGRAEAEHAAGTEGQREQASNE
jgi:hypothetical protein